MSALRQLCNVATAAARSRRSRVSYVESFNSSASREVKVELLQDKAREQEKENISPESDQEIQLTTLPSSEDCSVINPLANASMGDVLLSDTADTIVSANRKSQLTRLKSIKSLQIAKNDVATLRLFCNQVGLKGQRKKTKYDICIALVEARASGSWKKWKDNEDVKEKGKGKVNANVIINRRRFCNVIFSDIIRPQLATLGEKLGRAELDAGLKKIRNYMRKSQKNIIRLVLWNMIQMRFLI